MPECLVNIHNTQMCEPKQHACNNPGHHKTAVIYAPWIQPSCHPSPHPSATSYISNYSCINIFVH